MITNNSNKKEILFKAISVFIIKASGYGSGVIFLWIIANKLGARIQGIFSIALMFLSIGAMVSKLGVDTALVKWIAGSNSPETDKFILIKSFKLVLLSSLLTALALYGLSGVISDMYHKPDIKISIKYAALAIPFLTILDVLSNYFRGKKSTTNFGVYFHLLKFLFPLLIIVYFYLSNLSYTEIPIISYFLGLVLAVLLLIVHLYYIFNKQKTKQDKSFTYRNILLESYPMLMSSSIVLIMGWSDTFVLGFFVSEEKIGIYGTAIKLATIVSFIYNAIVTIVGPKVAAFFKENNYPALKETVSYSSKIMLLSGLPIFLILFVFPEFFLNIFGEKYILGKTVLRILLLAQFINVLTGPVGAIMNMTGNQNKLQQFIFFAMIFNIFFSLVLVQKFDLEGVAVASALGMIVWNIMGSLFIYKKMGIKTWYSLKTKRFGKF